jgi:16S rRNA (guanine527-N7)-methyltransferase
MIADHVRLLLAWNTAINLTAITEPEAIAARHVADSLAALPLLSARPPGTILDLGSGGGFPGVPLAVTLPAARVTLVESVGKKAGFLRAVVRALALDDRVIVANTRAEALAPGHWDVVTARAVATLATLVEVALPLLAEGGRLLAWKRGDLAVEMAAAGRAAAALGGSIPTWHPHSGALAAAAQLGGHGIIVVRKVAATPTGYPRDPSARARRPW